MFKLFLITIFVTATAWAAPSYDAEVRDSGSDADKILFHIEVINTPEKEKTRVIAKTLEGSNTVIEEEALVVSGSSEILEYKIKNYQTGESGNLVFLADKIQIQFKEKNKTAEEKEIFKPQNLVAPGNFEIWIRNNFEKIKKEKSAVINFLVWDRHEIVPFKVTYLGETTLGNETCQLFKMNIDNFLLAAFIDPVKIWYNRDMSRLRRYLGRVSVRKKDKNGNYSNLDADVKYVEKQ